MLKYLFYKKKTHRIHDISNKSNQRNLTTLFTNIHKVFSFWKHRKKTVRIKPHVKSFKQSLKLLFLSKILLTFLLTYFLGNFLLYWQYTQTLKQFALNVKIFTLSEIGNSHPINLLSDKFTCQTQNVILGCENYSFLFFFLIFFLEGFLIYSIFKYKKVIKKRIILLYAILLQPFLVLPFFVLMLTPYRLFPILTKQANKEIRDAMQLLFSEDGRKKQRIVNNLDVIEQTIKIKDNLPNLIEDNPKEQVVLQLLEITGGEKDSLYRLSIIPYQIYSSPEIIQEIGKINFEALLFPNNTLIPINISQNLITKIIPVLTRRILRKQFPYYSRKEEPIINVLTLKEYLEIRRIENEIIKKDFQGYINEINSNISHNQSLILEMKANIKANDIEYTRYKTYGEGWIVDCKRDFGVEDKDCKEGERTINSELQRLLDFKRENEQGIKDAQYYVTLDQKNLQLAQKNYEDFLKNPVGIGDEGGVFISPNKIYIKYEKELGYPFSLYLSYNIHEYLHWLSSQKTGSFPTFINEGLTDFLNEITLKSYFKTNNVDDHLGYPNEVKILQTIVKDIPKEKIMEVYFKGDENQFKNYFNNYFKAVGYDKFISIAERFSFTATKDLGQKEKLAKEINELLSNKTATASGN